MSRPSLSKVLSSSLAPYSAIDFNAACDISPPFIAAEVVLTTPLVNAASCPSLSV